MSQNKYECGDYVVWENANYLVVAKMYGSGLYTQRYQRTDESWSYQLSRSNGYVIEYKDGKPMWISEESLSLPNLCGQCNYRPTIVNDYLCGVCRVENG